MNPPLKNELLIAIIQSQDVDLAQNALAEINIATERLPSVGGFLGRRNATLMLKVDENNYQTAVNALNKSCRQRVEYIAVPLESAPLPLPTPTPITVGGATIFGLDIEHYEEI